MIKDFKLIQFLRIMLNFKNKLKFTVFFSTKLEEAVLDYFLLFFENKWPLSFSRVSSKIYFTLFFSCSNQVKSIIMTKLKTNTDGKKLASLSLVSINICTKFYASRMIHLILNICLFFCNKKHEKKSWDRILS